MLARIRDLPPNAGDPVEAFCDFLHHRFVMSSEPGFDVGDDAAFADWVARRQPGYEVA